MHLYLSKWIWLKIIQRICDQIVLCTGICPCVQAEQLKHEDCTSCKMRKKLKTFFPIVFFSPLCVYGFLENNTCTSQITKTSGVFLKFLIGPDWS